MRHTRAGLAQLQSLPLEDKIRLTKQRIEAWLEHWDDHCYVAFSGGKDSTVLLDIVRQVDPTIPGVFADTGLEFPEIKAFVRTAENVVWVRPKMSYREVVERYGYAVPSKRVADAVSKIRRLGRHSKTARYYLTGYTSRCEECNADLIVDVWACPNGHDSRGAFSPMAVLPKKWRPLLTAPFEVSMKCCDILKKNPSIEYEKQTGRKPFTGEMACDSLHREAQWLQFGCNAIAGRPVSKPLSFWTEADIWTYVRSRNLPYCSVYDQGYDRTGCVWCMFGVHMEKGENRFQKLERTHPKLHRYCIEKMGLGDVLDFIEIPYTQTQIGLFDYDPERDPAARRARNDE